MYANAVIMADRGQLDCENFSELRIRKGTKSDLAGQNPFTRPAYQMRKTIRGVRPKRIGSETEGLAVTMGTLLGLAWLGGGKV